MLYWSSKSNELEICPKELKSKCLDSLKGAISTILQKNDYRSEAMEGKEIWEGQLTQSSMKD